MNIHVKEFFDLDPGLSLAAGGQNHLAWSVSIKDGRSGPLLYQEELQLWTGYPPDGMAGLTIESNRDDELDLANKLATVLQYNVLPKHGIEVAPDVTVAMIGEQPFDRIKVPPHPQPLPKSTTSDTAILAALESAARPVLPSKARAFNSLPDRQLSEDEIRALFAGLKVDTHDADAETHTFGRNGNLDGIIAGDKNGRKDEDYGKWSVTDTGRLCMKWFDWYRATHNCYRVSKKGEHILLQADGERIDYTINN